MMSGWRASTLKNDVQIQAIRRTYSSLHLTKWEYGYVGLGE